MVNFRQVRCFITLYITCTITPLSFTRVQRHYITSFIGFVLLHLTIQPYYSTIAAQIASLYNYIVSPCTNLALTIDFRVLSQLLFVAVVVTLIFCPGADHLKCAFLSNSTTRTASTATTSHSHRFRNCSWWWEHKLESDTRINVRLKEIQSNSELPGPKGPRINRTN